MQRVASLRYGVIFKKAFSDVDIFKGFVRDILGIHLNIDKVETEKEFKPTIGPIAVKFDLYAEDIENRIIVEIQHDRNADHYDRFLHYHCVALLEQLKNPLAELKNDSNTSSKYKYCPNTTVYTIVVLTSGDFKNQCDVATIDFDPKTLDGKSLGEIKHKIIYLCPKYITEKTPMLYQEWLRVIEDSLDNKIDESQYHLSEIDKLLHYIQEDGVTPEDRARMIEESYLEEAEKKGREDGIAKGIKQGIEQGERRKAIEMAKAMLQKELPLEMIADITKLDMQILVSLNL